MSEPVPLQFALVTRACVGVRSDPGPDCTFSLIKSGVMKRERVEGCSMFHTEERFDSPDKRSNTSCLEGRDRNTLE